MVSLNRDLQEQILRALAKLGTDPRNFRFVESSLPGYEWQIIHQPSGQVIFGKYNGAGHFWTLRYSFNRRRQLVPISKDGTWDPFLKEIVKWGNEVKAGTGPGQREFDLTVTVNVYSSSDNNRFTVAEQSAISTQFRMIRESIRQDFKFTAEQLKRVEDRLSEAEEASRRLGRKDWILLFTGAIFSLILADVITPDIAQHMFMGLVHGVAHLFVSGDAPNRGALDR